jgi:hypothetical protein
MVFTAEERKLRKNEYNKKYREKNKEKISEKGKKYRDQENKEERAEYNKKYNKKYRHTPARIKSRTMARWKMWGLIHPDMSELYDKKYLPATHCEHCKKEFKDSFDKCMDHCHETGLFRQILCRSCNSRDSWKNK